MNAIGKAAAIAMTTTAINACGLLPQPSLTPDGPPTASQIDQTSRAFEDSWKELKGAGASATDQQKAQYFVTIGYERAASQCQVYFERLTSARQQNAFAKDTLVAAHTAAGLITTLAGASTGVIAALFGATGIVPATVDNYNKTFLLAEIADELYPKISGAMAHYRAQFPPEATNFPDNPTAKYRALEYVRSHASICTLPAMIAFAKAAAAAPTPEAPTNTETAGPPPKPPVVPALAVTPKLTAAKPPAEKAAAPRPGEALCPGGRKPILRLSGIPFCT